MLLAYYPQSIKLRDENIDFTKKQIIKQLIIAGKYI